MCIYIYIYICIYAFPLLPPRARRDRRVVGLPGLCKISRTLSVSTLKDQRACGI